MQCAVGILGLSGGYIEAADTSLVLTSASLFPYSTNTATTCLNRRKLCRMVRSLVHMRNDLIWYSWDRYLQSVWASLDSKSRKSSSDACPMVIRPGRDGSYLKKKDSSISKLRMCIHSLTSRCTSSTLCSFRYDMGIQSFDTANVYSNGVSEVILGKAIKQFNFPREEIVIMTKVCIDPLFLSSCYNLFLKSHSR